MAAKLVGNTAAAITLGPAFSAYKAVAGINAMRKDFAKFKNENPDKKGRFWKFIASKEGRKNYWKSAKIPYVSFRACAPSALH